MIDLDQNSDHAYKEVKSNGTVQSRDNDVLAAPL